MIIIAYDHNALSYDHEVIIMSSKVQVNIDPKLKQSAENIIKESGLTPTAVINGMYKQIVATGKIPLSIKAKGGIGIKRSIQESSSSRS